MSGVKVVNITFQNTTSDEVQISINGSDLKGVLPRQTTHTEQIDTKEQNISIKIRASSSTDSDRIADLEHGKNYN